MNPQPGPSQLPESPPVGGENELFPTRLPPRVARLIGLLIILIFCTAIVAAVTVRVPQAIRCPFILLAAGDPFSIQSPARGVVTRIFVEEGKWVEKGDPLFLIRSSGGSGRRLEPSALKGRKDGGSEVGGNERQRGPGTQVEKTGDQTGARPGESGREVLVLAAPASGMVQHIVPMAPGEGVENGQELCQMIRADGELRAKLSIPEEAVPKIQAGQPVKLLLNAFPYQRYGAKRGAIESVGSVPVHHAEKTSYQGFAKLIDTSVIIGGVAHTLRAGMRGEAQIILDRPLLIEYALEPLRQMKESMRDLQPLPKKEGRSEQK